jgi:hypothetical protein
MSYPRRARQPVYPVGASRLLEKHLPTPQRHIVSRVSPRSFYGRTIKATEKMTSPRISCVVEKPVCTPVPPAGYGNAAGSAGFAPPAFTWSAMATCRLAASGKTFPGAPTSQNKRARFNTGSNTGARHVLSQIFSSFGVLTLRSRPRAVNGAGSPAPASTWVRMPSRPMPPGAHACKAGPIDCLASGIGVNSHAPPV